MAVIRLKTKQTLDSRREMLLSARLEKLDFVRNVEFEFHHQRFVIHFDACADAKQILIKSLLAVGYQSEQV
jgi:hypothetical protein